MSGFADSKMTITRVGATNLGIEYIRKDMYDQAIAALHHIKLRGRRTGCSRLSLARFAQETLEALGENK